MTMPWTQERLAKFRRTMKAKKQEEQRRDARKKSIAATSRSLQENALPASFEAPLVEVVERHAREHAGGSDAKLDQLAGLIVAVWRRLP
jgi:hypothetical protein